MKDCIELVARLREHIAILKSVNGSRETIGLEMQAADAIEALQKANLSHVDISQPDSCAPVAEVCNLPFARVPQHAYDTGYGPVPPIPKVVQLHGRNDACCGKPNECDKNCYLKKK